MPLLWGLGLLAVAGFTAQSVNTLQDWGWVPEASQRTREQVRELYMMDMQESTGDNPWWNLRLKDYDTALVGLAVLGLLVWGAKG